MKKSVSRMVSVLDGAIRFVHLTKYLRCPPTACHYKCLRQAPRDAASWKLGPRELARFAEGFGEAVGRGGRGNGENFHSEAHEGTSRAPVERRAWSLVRQGQRSRRLQPRRQDKTRHTSHLPACVQRARCIAAPDFSPVCNSGSPTKYATNTHLAGIIIAVRPLAPADVKVRTGRGIRIQRSTKRRNGYKCMNATATKLETLHEFSSPSGTGTAPPYAVRHSPAEIAQLWGLSVDSVRKLFEKEPGVLILGNQWPRHGKRSYTTLRIPEHVVERVHRRLSRV